MGFIFNIPIANIDESNPQKALRQMWKYIKTLEEQLEYKLVNLDSSNVKEISTDETTITSGGSLLLSGEFINLSNGKYSFKAGGSGNDFLFELTNGNGDKVFFISNGNLVISRFTDLNIDGGTW